MLSRRRTINLMHEHSSASDMCISCCISVQQHPASATTWELQRVRASCGMLIKLIAKGQVLPLGFDICSPLSAVGSPNLQLHRIKPWHHGIGSSWLEASGFHSVRWNPPGSEHFKVFSPKRPKMTWKNHICSMNYEPNISKYNFQVSSKSETLFLTMRVEVFESSCTRTCTSIT